MKKLYFLLFVLLMGTGAMAQVDIKVELIGYTSLQATSDDPITLDFYVINQGNTVPTGDTVIVAFLITDLSTYVHNYSVTSLTSGSVNLLVLSQDFNNGDTIPVTGTMAMDMQWIYGEAGDVNTYVCADAAVGLTMFSTGVGDATPADNEMCVDYTVTWVTGTEEEAIKAISVYPNPAKDHMNIQLGNANVDYVQIMDISGRVIENIQVNSSIETLDVSSYQDGIYFYAIMKDGEPVKTDKFIVAK